MAKPHIAFPLQEETTDVVLRGPRRPERCGDWIQTASGVQFWPLDPRPEDIRLDDIATALSKICRWGGHIDAEGIFSVAQHSCLVAMHVEWRFKKQALLHDAHEAYIFDAPRPVKRYLINYDIIALRLDAAIGDRFGIELVDLPGEVKAADERSLATERRDLIVRTDWELTGAQGGRVMPWPGKIACWEPEQARRAFLGLAWRLGIR